MDQNARQQIIDRLKEANNVLITVSANPSVDQLAACIGITLVLNHLGKHATAVFSGEIPSTIEFLKPDDTIEKNTDSLRDFIIALDKAKADKLRYKVEDKVVKIFITPYRTSLSDKDLDFSQGDFNVDAVLALGVHERTDLDKAIIDHGRILHDATVISVNNKDQGNLGAINWVDLNASSLSEMLATLTKGITTDAIDGQMATAFMTGIVAETDRFSNTKTSPQTMSLASELMTAGANQQLIASKLEAAQPIPSAPTKLNKETEKEEEVVDGAGLLQINHPSSDVEEPAEPKKEEPVAEVVPAEPPLEPIPEPPVEPIKLPQIETQPQPDDEKGDLLGATPASMVNPPIMTHRANLGAATDRTIPAPAEPPKTSSTMTWEPPSLGGQLTANSQPEDARQDPSTDPLSLPSVDTQTPPPILNRPSSLSGTPIQPASPVDITNTDLKTLTGIEESVDSPHLAENLPTADAPKEDNLEDARDAVSDAIAAQAPTQPLAPIEGLGAQPVDLNLGNSPVQIPTQPPLEQPLQPPAEPPVQPLATPFGAPPDMNGVNPNIPTSLLPPSQPIDTTASNGNPTAPPPVPPPLMPPTP